MSNGFPSCIWLLHNKGQFLDGCITGENAEKMGRGKTELITMRESFYDPTFPFYIGIHNHLPSVYNHDPQKHIRSFWKIFYVMEGSGKHLINNHVQALHPGNICIVHPADRTSLFIETEHLNLCNLCFKLELLGETLKQLRNEYGFFSIFSSTYSGNPLSADALYLLDSDRTAVSILRRLLYEYEAERPNYREMIRALVVELLIHISRLYTTTFRREKRLAAVRFIRSWIEEHYAETPDYAMFARRIGISQGHLCSIYKAVTGTSISDDLRRKRMEVVCRALKNSNSSISEICYHSGFSDMSYFHKVFRSMTGTTPRLYRLSQKSGLYSDFSEKRDELQ